MTSLTSNELLKLYPVPVLQQASIFGAISADTINWLVHEGKKKKLAAGEVLFEPGQRGDSFYIILDGKIALYNTDGQQFAHTRDYETGQQVGFVSVIALHDRIGKAVATIETVTLEIDYQLFYRLHNEHPADFGLMMLNLAREMARTIRAMGATIAQLKSH